MARLPKIAAAAAAVLALAAGQADAAVTVAGAPPNAMLTAADGTNDGRAELDLTLIGPADAGTPGDFTTTESDPPPVWADEAVVASETLPSPDGTIRILVGGAVSAEAATIELGFGGGHFLRVATSESSAYQGRNAGQIRFFLGEVTLPEADVDDDPESIRMLDASGAVIGVAHSPDIKHTVPISRRRAGGALIRMAATLTSRLAALAGAPEHRSEQVCLTEGLNEAADSTELACQSRDEPMPLGGLRGCDRVPTTLAGFAPAATAAVVVRLGSGRSLRLPTRAAPFGRPNRIVTAVLPGGEAIRTATAIDGAGHELATADVALAPPDRRCDEPVRTYGVESWSAFADSPEPQFGTPPGLEVAASAGDRRLVVRDQGEDLCIGFDSLDLLGNDCAPPPFSSHEAFLYVDPSSGLVAGLFAARVAAIDLSFQGGGTMRIPAAEGTGYTGRYRSLVHFAFALAPAGRLVTGAVLLDAGGRAIGTADPDGPALDDKQVRRPRTVLASGSGQGAARVVVGGDRGAFSPRIFACVGLELGSQRSNCDDDFSFSTNTVNAVVRCGPRETVLFGITRPDVVRVDVRLSTGREVQPRMARMPSGLGTHASVYLAVLPRNVAVTRVHFARKHERGRSDNAVLPTRSPAEQCGYRVRDIVF